MSYRAALCQHLLNSTLMNIGCLNIDWRDVEEVELQGNALADIHGVKEHFICSEPGEDTSVWHMLVLYDLWLQARGYEVVLWDIDADHYTGLICRTDVLDKLLNEGRKLGLAMVKLDHERAIRLLGDMGMFRIRSI